jgi:hypothetical protein
MPKSDGVRLQVGCNWVNGREHVYKLPVGWDDDWAPTCGGCWSDGRTVAPGHLGAAAAGCWV